MGGLADYGKNFISIKGIITVATLLALMCSSLLFYEFDFFVLLIILVLLNIFS